MYSLHNCKEPCKSALYRGGPTSSNLVSYCWSAEILLNAALMSKLLQIVVTADLHAILTHTIGRYYIWFLLFLLSCSECLWRSDYDYTVSISVGATLKFGKISSQLPRVDNNFQWRIPGFIETWLIVEHHDNKDLRAHIQG